MTQNSPPTRLSRYRCRVAQKSESDVPTMAGTRKFLDFDDASTLSNQLKRMNRPGKTFIERFSRMVEFCGFQFSTNGAVGLTKSTANNDTRTQSRLYEHEQGANVKQKKHQAYLLAWLRGVLTTVLLSERFVWPLHRFGSEYEKRTVLRPGGYTTGDPIDEPQPYSN